MEYLKKSFSKLKEEKKLEVTTKLIDYLISIKKDINNNSCGKKFISLMGFDKD